MNDTPKQPPPHPQLPNGQPALPLFAPLNVIQIQPTVTDMSLSKIVGPDGRDWFVQQIATSSGVNFVFYTPELLDQFLKLGESLKSNIVPASPFSAQQLVEAMSRRGRRPQ